MAIQGQMAIVVNCLFISFSGLMQIVVKVPRKNYYVK